MERVTKFFSSRHFLEMEPVPGAAKALDELAPLFKLAIVTSRQHFLRDDTLVFLERHFPGKFDPKDVHFGNHYGAGAAGGLLGDRVVVCSQCGCAVSL